MNTEHEFHVNRRENIAVMKSLTSPSLPIPCWKHFNVNPSFLPACLYSDFFVRLCMWRKVRGSGGIRRVKKEIQNHVYVFIILPVVLYVYILYLSSRF